MTLNIGKAKGPFTILVISLIISESLLLVWMLLPTTDSPERIVAGSLSIAVFIAYLVVFCTVYWIKTAYKLSSS